MNTQTSPQENPICQAAKMLFKKNLRVAIVATGGGSGIVQDIWKIPGASSFLVDFSFPYAQAARNNYLARSWYKSSCCQETAIALAQEAFFRCQQFCSEDNLEGIPLGIGLTAATTTSRTLRGGTRIFASLRTKNSLYTVGITLQQGFLGREGDGRICDLVMLNLLLFAAKLPQIPFSQEIGLQGEQFQAQNEELVLVPKILNSPEIPEVSLSPILLSEDGRLEALERYDFSKTVVYPGAFSIFHYGHDAIAQAIEKITGRKVVLEITSQNADKDIVALDTLIQERAWQFQGRWPTIFRQDAGLFMEKVPCYPGAHFAVGTDTAYRILDPKYYGGVQGLENMLQKLLSVNTKIYVFNREGADDWNLVLQNPYFSKQIQKIFVLLPGRWNISSTHLRSEAL